MEEVKTNKVDEKVLLREIVKRKSICLDKLNKLENRIKILESFKNQSEKIKTNLDVFLNNKGLNYRDFFVPIGYYTGKDKVVSNDIENKYLTYHNGMVLDKNIGFHTPKRNLVRDIDHTEVVNSKFGMKFNPQTKKYSPKENYSTELFCKAEGYADRGLDIMGGFTTADISKLTNSNIEGRMFVSFVQDLLQEEYDNVQDELELIDLSTEKLKSKLGLDFSSADGKAESGKNLVCRTGCATKHPFSKKKREECEKACDVKFKPSLKQSDRREDRDERKDERKELRADKKTCKENYNTGKITKSEYLKCVKAEKKEKREAIKNAGGNFFVRGWRGFAKINPITAVGRGGALVLIQLNIFGLATRLSPALLPSDEANKLFTPEGIDGAKKSWIKVEKAWKNLGGDINKLKNAIIKGYKKKVMKVTKKSSFEGDNYSFLYENNYSNFALVDDAAVATAIVEGLGIVSGILGSVAMILPKDPYRKGQAPDDYEKSLKEGDLDTPPLDPKAPVVDKDGNWVDPETGRKVDPKTGEFKDNILGMNKWLALGLGASLLLGTIYLIRKNK